MVSSPTSWCLRQSVLRDILSAARRVYPDEFISLLGVDARDKKLICELVVVPAEFGKAHSSLRYDLVPFDSLVVGTVHSHPSPNATPSSADLNVFSRMGSIHLIVGYPFDESSVRAYSSRGKRVGFVLV